MNLCSHFRGLPLPLRLQAIRYTEHLGRYLLRLSSYMAAPIRRRTENRLDRVRRHIDILALIGAHVVLAKKDRSYVGLCPFHKEKSPSFHVNTERGFFYCFACHKSGDAIKFWQLLKGLDFGDAVEDLESTLGKL